MLPRNRYTYLQKFLSHIEAQNFDFLQREVLCRTVQHRRYVWQARSRTPHSQSKLCQGASYARQRVLWLQYFISTPPISIARLFCMDLAPVAPFWYRSESEIVGVVCSLSGHSANRIYI